MLNSPETEEPVEAKVAPLAEEDGVMGGMDIGVNGVCGHLHLGDSRPADGRGEKVGEETAVELGGGKVMERWEAKLAEEPRVTSCLRADMEAEPKANLEKGEFGVAGV